MASLTTRSVTCTAPVNIALIKYWGKRDEKLVLPVNDSLSVTLNQDTLCSRTSAKASTEFETDRFWLNGEECSLAGDRMQNVLAAIRSRASDYTENGVVVFTKENWSRMRLHIVSVNNFPTAAGLASSASGFACLVFTLAQLFGVKEEYPGELTSIARMGSGSACRSLDGGFVKWNRGNKPGGEDSYAVEVAPKSAWPDMHILILVVNDKKKDTSSTSGMKTSVETSDLIQHRADVVVPERCARIEKAIHARDFETVGQITMQDSNQFHAICLDTYPPIFYLNDDSRFAIQLIDRYNKAKGVLQAAYTFDAGPNCVLLVPDENIKEVLALVMHYFPGPTGDKENSYLNDWDLYSKEAGPSESLQSTLGMEPQSDALKYILHTTVGDGPRILGADASLQDASTGLPLTQ